MSLNPWGVKLQELIWPEKKQKDSIATIDTSLIIPQQLPQSSNTGTVSIKQCSRKRPFISCTISTCDSTGNDVDIDKVAFVVARSALLKRFFGIVIHICPCTISVDSRAVQLAASVVNKNTSIHASFVPRNHGNYFRITGCLRLTRHERSTIRLAQGRHEIVAISEGYDVAYIGGARLAHDIFLKFIIAVTSTKYGKS